jgi:hypothetical protein
MNLAGFLSRRLVVRLPCLSLVLLAALAVCGCATVAGSGSITLVRVIDASSNAGALDAYVSSTPIAVNVIGPSIGNYAFLPPGEAIVDIEPTGKRTVLAQMNGTFSVNQQHSVYITDQGTSFQANLLTDQNTPAPAGFVSIRFLQQASSTGAVDIYFIPDGTKIADVKPVLSSLPPGTITAYLDIPTGTYDLAIAAAGTTTGAYTSAATSYTTGQVRTMLIVDQQLLNAPPVNVLIADDLN